MKPGIELNGSFVPVVLIGLAGIFALAANVGKQERDRNNQRHWRMAGTGRFDVQCLVALLIADGGSGWSHETFLTGVYLA